MTLLPELPARENVGGGQEQEGRGKKLGDEEQEGVPEGGAPPVLSSLKARIWPCLGEVAAGSLHVSSPPPLRTARAWLGETQLCAACLAR